MNWSMGSVDDERDARAVLSCPYFWFGYRQAWDGLPFIDDVQFDDLVGDALKLAQLRYENGREIAIEAKCEGFPCAWRVQFPLPSELVLWCIEDRPRTQSPARSSS